MTKQLSLRRATLLAAVVALGGTASAQNWGAPVPIAKPDFSVIQLDATVVMDRFGGTIAAWSQQSAGPQAAIKRAGSPWSAVTKLSGPKSTALDTSVAVGRDGTAVAIWVDIIPGRYGRTEIEAATLLPGAAVWGAPETLSPTDPSLSQAHVAIDGQGNVVATWLHSDGVHLRVQAVERPLGGSWSLPRDISDASNHALLPQLAMNANGVAIAVWQSAAVGYTPSRLDAAVRSGAGSWSSPIHVTAIGTNVWNPQVVIDELGRGAIAWNENGAIMTATQARRGTMFSAPALVSVAAEWSDSPALATDDAGNLIVAWSALLAPPLSTHATKVATRPALGGSFSSPRQLSDTRFFAIEDVGPPQVAASGDGSVIVVTWEDNVTLGVRAATYGKLFGAGGKWWSPAQTLARSGLWNDPIPVAAGPDGIARVLFANGLSHYQTQLNAIALRH